MTILLSHIANWISDNHEWAAVVAMEPFGWQFSVVFGMDGDQDLHFTIADYTTLDDARD
jgi:hypothetical protein